MSTESFVVIGGDGFLGHALVLALSERYPNSSIASLDLVQRHEPTGGKWSFHSCDLTSLPNLLSTFALTSPTTVFHTASPWTGSGKDICQKVNVEGTKNIVEACKGKGVKKLVFTSSAGTVYDGQDLINVDERLNFPEVPLDAYNETKALAEQIVLKANGENDLLTCALRPAGIFGPGDRQAIPGFMAVLKNNQTKFQIGDNTNLFDWTYVDNVVHAHILASEKLAESVPSPEAFWKSLKPINGTAKMRDLPTSAFRPGSDSVPSYSEDEKVQSGTVERDPPLPNRRNRYDQFDHFLFSSATPTDAASERQIPIAGQAYFITNGEPMPFWDFPRAIWREYNGHVPSYTIPLPRSLGLFAAGAAEWVGWLMGRKINLTRDKVAYSCANRYYSIDRARRMLGYEPVVSLEEGIKRAMEWYRTEGEKLPAKTG